MLTRLHVIAPDVARHRRSVMLAPLILHALLVLIDHGIAVARETNHLGRAGQHHCRFATCSRHAVKLCEACAGEHGAFCRVLDGSREIHELAIGTVGPWRLCRRVIGELLGCATLCRHHVEVEIALAVAGKCYLLAIGAPYGVALIRVLRCQLHSCSATGFHFVDVALVAEDYLLSVGRNLYISQPQRSDCHTA